MSSKNNGHGHGHGHATRHTPKNSSAYRKLLNDRVAQMQLNTITSTSITINELIDIEQKINVTKTNVDRAITLNASLAIQLTRVSWYDYSQRKYYADRINSNAVFITECEKYTHYLHSELLRVTRQLDVMLNTIKRG
jgi:hypothetical protein